MEKRRAVYSVSHEYPRGFLAALASGVELVKETANKQHLIDLGVSTTLAGKLVKAHEMLFDRTKFSRYQERCRRSAEGKSGETLIVIAETSGRIKDEKARWEFREELCALNLGPNSMKTLANKRVKEIQPTVRKPKVAYARHDGNMASCTITADRATIEDLRAQIQTVDDVTALFDGSLLPKQKGNLHIIIHDEQLRKILDGEEVRLQMTNGAEISSTEIMERASDDLLFGTIMNQVLGPIDAFETARFANFKQRLMLSAQYPTCVWDDCRVPLSECEIHHIEPWVTGGPTNLNNLVPLCKYHNRINDDARAGSSRGYVIKMDNKVRRVFAKA